MNVFPPIIAIDGGDVLAFRGVEAAERSLEAIDIERGIYEIFDASGRKLEGIVTRRWMRIELRLSEDDHNYVSYLSQQIKKFLLNVGTDSAWVASASFKQLVDKVVTDYPAI